MRTIFLAGLLLTPRISAAQSWTPAEPSGALDENNPSSAATLRFQDALQNKGYHQICETIPLHVDAGDNQGLSGSLQNGDNGFLAGGEGKVGRWFYRSPTGTLTLVDRVGLDLSLGYSQTALPVASPSPLALILSTRLQGESVVVRPLKKQHTCQELGELVKLKTFKTAIPPTAARIADMEVGEVWKLPIAFEFGVGPYAGSFPANASLKGTVYFSPTYSKGRGAMVTLYRVGASELRFRLRMDRLTSRGVDGGVTVSPLPLLQEGEPAVTKLLARVLRQSWAGDVSDLIANALAGYFTSVLSFSVQSADSKDLLVEYVLDPTDPAQLQGLEKAINGDLLSALKLFSGFNKTRPAPADSDATLDFLDGVESHNSETLGRPPRYAGADQKHSRLGDLHLVIPPFIDFDRQTAQAKDRIITSKKEDGELHSASATKDVTRAYLPLPILGAIKRTQKQHSVQAAVDVPAVGAPSGEVVVYIQHEGYLRGGHDKERQMAAGVNRLMGRLGGAGPDPAPGTQVPLPPKGTGSFNGASSLTLVLLPKAVSDIVKTAPVDLVAAYGRSLEGEARMVMETIIGAGRVRPDGRIIDPGSLFPNDNNLISLAESLAGSATGLVRDVRRAGDAPTPERRAQALVSLLSGKGQSGLAYEAAMSVVLQLVDAKDVGGQYLDIVNATGGGDSVIKRYVYNPDVFSDPLVQELGRDNRRFMKPLTNAE